MDEQEQLDALKKWWAENGKLIIIGVAIGVAGIGGFNWWQANTIARQEAASAQFQEAMRAAVAPDGSDADAAPAEALAGSGGTYGTLAAMLAARAAADRDDVDAAAAHLRGAINSAEDTAMRSLAQLRLARVLVATGDLSGATANLDAIESPAFEALGAELRGDIAAARDDADTARSAWEQALASERLPPDSAARLRLKLDALGRYTTPPSS